MRRTILFLLVAVMAASACTKKVSSEKLIVDLTGHFDKKGSRYTEQLAKVAPEKRAGFITLKLDKDLGAEDLWTIGFEGEDGQVVVAEFPSRDKEAHISLISACLDDAAACSAVLDVLDAFRQAKVRPATTLRAVFYDSGASGTEGMKVLYDDLLQSYETATFDIEVTSCDSLPARTFIIEEKPFFSNQMIDVIPAYLETVAPVEFEVGPFPRENWPSRIPTYRYCLGTDRLADLKLLTAFTLLVN